MFSVVTAAKALSHRANESDSALTMSDFVMFLPASVGLPALSSRGCAAVSPARRKHAPLLSSTMCDSSPPQVRTSGVGDQLYLSSGNWSAALVMLVLMLLKMFCTSTTSVGKG